MSGREIAIARELTKRFEEVARGVLPLGEDHTAGDVKGEIVLVVAPPGRQSAPDEYAIRSAVLTALERMSMRDAVEEVARTLRVPRRLVYGVALAMRKG